MRTKWQYLPGMLVLLCAFMMLMHGAIPQYAHYHAFADTASYWQIPNAMDVLSNLAFAIIGLLGLLVILISILFCEGVVYVLVCLGIILCLC